MLCYQIASGHSTSALTVHVRHLRCVRCKELVCPYTPVLGVSVKANDHPPPAHHTRTINRIGSTCSEHNTRDEACTMVQVGRGVGEYSCRCRMMSAARCQHVARSWSSHAVHRTAQSAAPAAKAGRGAKAKHLADSGGQISSCFIMLKCWLAHIFGRRSMGEASTPPCNLTMALGPEAGARRCPVNTGNHVDDGNNVQSVDPLVQFRTHFLGSPCLHLHRPS
jgi:hypothetical protein